MLRAGMILYDLLSRRTTMPRRRWIDRERMLALQPGLAADGLRGAWRFYDAQCELVERLVVENVVDARSHGAAVLTHARVARWLREDGAVVGAEVEHRGRTMPIRARQTVNATGAWLDQLGPHARRCSGSRRACTS
jgi:glycerol-3-phosphate dehydrogenase